LRLLDICFGLGYNSAALLDALWQTRPEARVELFALEADPTPARTAYRQGWLAVWPRAEPPLGVLAEYGRVESAVLDARLLLGDARRTVAAVPEGWADGIFLDPFSPEVCPQLWSVEFLDLVARRLAPAGVLVTYASAAAVRTALGLAGLAIGATAPFGRRAPGTIAAWHGPLPPLGPEEREHLQTRAAVPYRDPTLDGDAEFLRARRRAEQVQSPLEPTSRWRRRWQKAAGRPE
jgi:tRNA U34 5-methylaminomethyl-2-thiouridine-forming methyltransferase MnmC